MVSLGASIRPLTWWQERFSMFKVADALARDRARRKMKNPLKGKLWPQFPAILAFSCGSHRRASSGLRRASPVTIAQHELRFFCYGGALHQSNGEYPFHCALKDHNLEMLRVKNNLLSCMLNGTCLLLTSEATEINPASDEKKNKTTTYMPMSVFVYLGGQTRRVFCFVCLFSPKHNNICVIKAFFEGI